MALALRRTKLTVMAHAHPCAATDFDVICVGSGPAGNLACYLLARSGLSVLLLERQALPRRKVCGGGLTARALAALPYDIASIVHRRIDSACIAFPGHRNVQLDSPGFGAMVERSELDAFMADQAVRAGTQLLASTTLLGIEQPTADRMRVHTTRGSFTARLLIGADGAGSTVRRALFPAWRPTQAFGVEANYFPRDGADLPAHRRRQALFDFGQVRSGYGWIFPKRNHYNVGIYRFAKHAASPGLRQALSTFAAGSPLLAGFVAAPPEGHAIPLSTGRQPLGQGRSVLIGDAAGTTEAFFGEGIAFALKSATLAADWARRWLVREHGDAAVDFGLQMSPLVTELRWSTAVARARYRVPPRWMARAFGKPSIRDATIALLNGEISYRRAFWQMPMLLLPTLWPRHAGPDAASPGVDGGRP